MHKPISETFTRTSRRRFLQGTAAASALAMASPSLAAPAGFGDQLPEAFSGLKPLGARVRPVVATEFQERLAHAQKLMAEPKSFTLAAPPIAKYDALFFAPGTSLYYFTGIHWDTSERLLGLVLPRTGNSILVVAGFEEGRLRERLKFPMEIRVWQEDESPTKLAAAALADRGIRGGRMGIEETVRFTF